MRLVSSSIALVACASLAAAADFGGPYGHGGSIKDGPYVAAAPSWSGMYIGAHAGWMTSNWTGTVATFGDSSLWTPPSRSLDDDSWLTGGQVGFNLQSGSVVYGLEADMSFAHLSHREMFSTDPFGDQTVDGINIYNWDINAKLDRFGTVRVRLGYLIQPALMLYATGGLAWGQTESDITVSWTFNGTDKGVTARGSDDHTHFGWAAGLGGEVQLADSWYLRGEWLHVDLGSKTFNYTGTTVGDDPYAGDSMKSDLVFDVFRVGLNYKFSN